MAETITSARVRIACHTDKYDQLLDQRTGKPVVFWGGNDIDFDIGVFFGNEPANLSNLTSISLEVKPLDGKKPPSPDTTPLMSKTVTGITATITQAGWDDYSEQHCVISFTDAESNLEAGNYWIAVSYLTSAGKIATIGAGVITIKQDGTGPVLPPDPIDPPYVTQDELENYYLKTEADARYLQIANNLSDLNDVPVARTNLGLGSAATQDSSDFATAAQGSKADTALQPGITNTSGVRHDGTIVAPNALQIPIITGNGWIGTSGKGFGATPSELQQNADPDKVASLADLPFSWINFREIDLNSFNVSETTGTGTTGISDNRFIDLYTGATAGSTAALIRLFSSPGWSRGNRSVVYTSRRSLWHIRVWSDDWTPTSQANLICYGRRGTGAELYGPLLNRGWGWRIKAGTAGDSTLYALYRVSNAPESPEIEIDTGFSFGGGAGENRFLTIEIVGNGIINWYENGTLLASVSDFGTASGSLNYSGFDVTNGTDESPARLRIQTFNVFVV